MATTDDAELSRSLTASIRAVEGVTGVFPSQPLLEAAADALAVRLDLREPDEMVDIDRSDHFTTVTAHIATSASLPAPETVRRVGEGIRDAFLAAGTDPDELAVNVKVRLIEDSGLRSPARQAAAAEEILEHPEPAPRRTTR